MTKGRKFLYCFKGTNSDAETLNTFERLDLKNPDSKWEMMQINKYDEDILNIQKKKFVMFELYKMNLQLKWIDSDNIMIFGGL